MSRLGNVNFDVLKRPRVLISIVAVVVLAIVWYLAWWSPESSKLSSVRAQETTEKATIATDRATLAQLTGEAHYDKQYAGFLKVFQTAVPVQPEQGQLVTDLAALEKADKVTIASIDDSTTVPASTGSTLSTIPVTLSVTGPHIDVLKFLSDLYNLKVAGRLLTIQQLNPSPEGVSSGGNGAVGYNVLQTKDTTNFSLSIQATAYFTGTITPPPA